LAKAPRYLLDVNVLVALLDENHNHHSLISAWYDTPNLQWAICPFTEAGFLRYMTRPRAGDLTVQSATAMLTRLAEQPGFHYQPISADWHTLSAPLTQRLFGHNQITDAFLLGLAIHENLILATFDKAILHLAGKHSSHVLLLTE
jgi:toxin-antitoxin system PIN domain toxin